MTGTGRRIGFLLLALVGLASCGEREVILPGVREDPRAVSFGAMRSDGAEVAVQRPLALPAAQLNQSWTHRGGNARHAIGHLALPGGGLTLAFAAPIGEGDSRRARITGDPVVVGSTIYAMDARGSVSAVSASGQLLWRSELRRDLNRLQDASGGGLAYGNGRLYATTGFGQLVALDPATGARLWVQDLDAAGGAAPTVAGDLVYVSSRDSRAWAVDSATGRIAWTRAGVPSPAGSGGGAGPAVADGLVLFPLSSGEVAAHFAIGGQQRWSAYVVGERTGFAAATISDIGGDPVIADGRVYAGNVSGRLAALDLATGDEIWAVRDGAVSPVWAAGGSIFYVNDVNQLVRRDAASGGLVWRTQLPWRPETRGLFGPTRDRIFAHYGPVLASGRLYVAGSDGALRAFDPRSGGLIAETALPGGATSNPVVAGGTLYVVSGEGQLLAFR
ncbi:PQQ-binding-like beta-propeller repeat protein [Histidinibacterium lentulum]|nr:PQQ-binding-like beta-propeller repeat protein [Histidinibacterium lentulum]